mgnify:CR=1 FL=1
MCCQPTELILGFFCFISSLLTPQTSVHWVELTNMGSLPSSFHIDSTVDERVKVTPASGELSDHGGRGSCGTMVGTVLSYTNNIGAFFLNTFCFQPLVCIPSTLPTELLLWFLFCLFHIITPPPGEPGSTVRVKVELESHTPGPVEIKLPVTCSGRQVGLWCGDVSVRMMFYFLLFLFWFSWF